MTRSVCWLVGRSVRRSVCNKFPKGREVSLPCSYQILCYTGTEKELIQEKLERLIREREGKGERLKLLTLYPIELKGTGCLMNIYEARSQLEEEGGATSSL